MLSNRRVVRCHGIAGLVLGFIAVIGGLSIAALAIILGIRHDRRKREMEHIERMKALELGRTLPQDEPWLSPAKIAAADRRSWSPSAVFVSCRDRKHVRRLSRGDVARGGDGRDGRR